MKVLLIAVLLVMSLCHWADTTINITDAPNGLDYRVIVNQDNVFVDAKDDIK